MGARPSVRQQANKGKRTRKGLASARPPTHLGPTATSRAFQSYRPRIPSSWGRSAAHRQLPLSPAGPPSLKRRPQPETRGSPSEKRAEGVARMSSAEKPQSPAGIAETVDLKRLREEWTLYIHSKEFEQLTDKVFHKACNLKDGLPGHDDDELDQAELQYAMDEMYERLNIKANGKLPKSKDSALKLLRRFDQDKNGRLDLQEFRRFAMVYFNRLEWPPWKAALKGVAVAIGAYVAWKVVAVPVIAKTIGLALPKVVKSLQQHVSDRLARKVDAILVRFSDANPLSVSEEEARILEQKERAERWRERRVVIKEMVVASSVGASAAVAGLM